MSLDVLNDDVICLIAEALADIHRFGEERDKRFVANLSNTTRRLRRICLSILFRTCSIGRIAHSESFPPPTIWTYIRTLELYISSSFIPQFCENARHAFPQFPQLHTISLARYEGGITADILQIMFSAPALQGISLLDIEWMKRGATYVMEIVPTKIINLGLMASVSWPSLRELTLSGTCPIIDVPIASVICAIPQLRTLRVAFVIHGDHPRIQIWPPDFSTTLEFPHLETFVLSFPDPNDKVFSKLTPHLRHLSLRDTPRKHFNMFNDDTIRYPIPSSDELLQILQKIHNSARLIHLEIVYHAGFHELEMHLFEAHLFDTISMLFPLLSSLEVHRPRYRCTSHDVRKLVTHMTSLKQLKTLRLDLGAPRAPVLLGTSAKPKTILDEHCEIVVSIMPWLHSIAFLDILNHAFGCLLWFFAVEYSESGGAIYSEPAIDGTFF